MKGWVYVITNKAMPGLVKVGFSRKDPDLRAEELGNTAVPHPYKVQYEVLVEHPYLVEQKTHKVLRKNKEGKEWFRCDVGDAIAAIKTVVNKKILYEKNNHQKSATPSKSNFVKTYFGDDRTGMLVHKYTKKGIILYKKGFIVNAIKLFNEAGEEGDFWSCRLLAAHYNKMAGKLQKNENYKKAFYWSKKAAEVEGEKDVKGNLNIKEKADIYYLLGMLYKYGYGTEQNIDKAVFWLTKSSADGNENAKEALIEHENAKRVLNEHKKEKASLLERVKHWLF
jgi:hypothetical protein